jgi:hypothetical protein
VALVGGCFPCFAAEAAVDPAEGEELQAGSAAAPEGAARKERRQ